MADPLFPSLLNLNGGSPPDLGVSNLPNVTGRSGLNITLRHAAGIGAPLSPMVAMPNANAAPAISAPSLHPAAPNQVLTDQSNLNALQSSPAGVAQIHNPFLRIPAEIGDALFSRLVPGLASATPGTTAHHNLLVNQAENRLAFDQNQAQQQAKTAQEQALASQEQSKAEALQNPQKAVDPSKTVTTEDGVFQLNPDTGKYDIRVGDAKPAPPHYTNMPDGSVVAITTDKNGNPSAKVVYKGDPKVETQIVPLEIGGVEHSVIVNKQDGTPVKDLGPTGNKPPSVTVNENHQFQEQERGRGLLDKAEGAYRTAQQSANTMLDMVASARAGNKMSAQVLPLEGALAITTAQGVHRINRTEVDQYAGAGSLYDRIAGELGKLSSGQQIPKNILDDIVRLTQIQQRGAYGTYKGAFDSATKRYGLNDETPLPEPGGGGSGGNSQHKVGDKVQLNGQTVTIKKINNDGTFDY